MSVNSFKFVSPGIFINEVDNSQLPRLPEELGPVIIGRAERGPSMVPVKIDSFSEFVETFGNPIAGGEGDDVWRQGNRLGPTYAAFAAQAYLKSASPITFVRLLGEHSPDAAGDPNKAGWSVDHAYGLFVRKSADGAAKHLAAVIYSDNADLGLWDDSVPAKSNAEIDVTSGKIPFADDAGTAGVAAQATITLSLIDSGNVAANNAGFFVVKDGSNQVTLQFDLAAATNVWSGSAPTQTVTIGLLNTIGDVSLQAKAIADALNEEDSDVTVTASFESESPVVTLVQDAVGEFAALSDFLANSGAPSLTAGGSFPSGSAATTIFAKTTFNFDENSKLYIRNILNTNPTLTNSAITQGSTDASPALKNYWLGSTFDMNLERVGLGNSTDINKAQLIKLADVAPAGSPEFKNMHVEASSPSTPMVVSQYLGLPGDFDPADPAVQNLFQIHALYAGDWEQKNFKISISDVAAPKNSFTKYGTFSVIVRDAKDTDAAPIVYERFSNCDLDPTSSNYIGVKIGDMKQVWSDSENRYIEQGQYLNQSRFIRVEVTSEVESGVVNPELLPFGFEVPKTVATTSDYTFPQLSLRATSKGTKISSPSQAFFGVTSENSDERYDASYADAVRKLVKVESATTLPERTKFFSLDLLKENGENDAEYDEASMTGGTSFNAVSGDYSSVLNEGFNKFTMPLTGGFDGLDITEIEPFNDIRSGSSADTDYAFYSMKKAIDTVSDPEVVECNLMAIPGVANPGITSHLISTCENRADALAVIDIENDYTPRGWDKTSEANRLPQVDLAVNTLRDRRINSSYGCAYFPWVQVRDSLSNKLVWMPPSVAALGTMASSAAKSELWFAPAGFTRGGLSNGAAGLPVVQTRYRLTSKHRDSLYEANINPIAQFPAEGIVIFGQKTLQVTPSALDRINVRRLMVYVKKEISRMAATLLFDQNVDTTWNRFLSKAEPFLSSVKSRFGLTEYRVVLDETTTTPELVDRNIVYAKVFLKPARAIEFIAIDFVITNTGASFDD